jgi:hypothetical protein
VTCPASFTQDAFRGRNDDGNETTATWKEAQSTNWKQTLDVNFRVRFRAQEGAACAGNNKVWRLQYNKNAAGWVDGSASSSVVRASASPNLADAAAVTDQLSGGTGTFVGATGFDEVDCNAGGSSMDVAASGQSECEFCCQLRSADVVYGDTIQLRITDAGTALASYTQTPTMTAGSIALAADNLGGSQDFSRLASAFRIWQESMGFADAFSRRADALRLTSDSAGFSDSASRIVDAQRLIADFVAFQDNVTTSVQGGTTFFVSTADNLGLHDEAQRLAEALRIFTDSQGHTNAFARHADALRVFADSIAFQDSTSRLANAARVFADSVGSFNEFSRQASAFRSVQEMLGLADSILRTVSTFRIVADLFGFSDGTSRRADAFRLVSDFVAFQDSVTTLAVGGTTYLVGIADSLGLHDEAARLANALRVFTDSAGTVDSTARLANAMRQFADSVASQDTTARLANFARLLADNLACQDVIADIIAALALVDPTPCPSLRWRVAAADVLRSRRDRCQ